MILRLISYNIQRGIHLEELAAIFATSPAFREADVIAVQEASLLPDGRNILAVLAGVLSADHAWTYRTVMAYPDKEYGNGFLFSGRCRARDAYEVALPRVANLRWHERRKTEGGRPDRKAAFVQGLDVDGHPVRLANVHLDFAGGWRHRRRQLDHLLAEMERRTRDRDEGGDGPLDVLCGDFNTVGQYRSPSTRRSTGRALQGAFARGYADATAGLPFTSDLFGSVDPADPAARVLGLGRKLGLRLRQKTDHILIRGDVSA
jgi:endonuclease/exonuclease/phosphatase family metal-dependent hydrolase